MLVVCRITHLQLQRFLCKSGECHCKYIYHITCLPRCYKSGFKFKKYTTGFVNTANNLHLSSGNCSLYGAGTPIVITVDYDNETRKNPPDLGADENIGTGAMTWTGLTSTDWNVATNWCPPVVPLSSSNVTIPSAPINQPLISNANAVCKDLTINAGAAHLDMSTSRTLTLTATAVFTNNGAFNCGVANEEVIFAGTGTVTGASPTTFRNLTINATTTLLSIPTISANLKLNSTANVTASPNYGASSTLIYNNTGSYNVVTEWTGSAITAGTGVPNNVIIQNGTTLNMPAALRGMAGDLTISSGTLQMNGTSGADLNIGGNWTRVAATGVFNPNSRAVSFKGAANQTVTVVGGGIERFNILVIDKPNAGTYLLPSAVVGNLTDITVNGNMASNVAVLQFINQGSLDLNGRTFRVDGNNSSSYPGHIYVNGARTIYNSSGITNGSFAIMSSANPNQSTWYTRSVWNNFGTGTLTFNQDVLVTLADGRMDWGLDALGVNVTTIQGVLQINLGGSVVYNSCYYSSSPPSTLRFANTIDYQVNAGDKTWAFGAIYSGLPGIPFNVDINNTNTDLTINEVRALRNNLTITDGRLTINAGPFNVGGDWTRTNPAGVTVPPCAFIPNSNKVVFDKTGAVDQIITCTVNSNTETFYDLDISPATVNVAFGGATNVVVTNNLILTSGKVDMNGNMLTLGTTSGAGTLTGGSASSYLLAYKAAVNGTFRRYTPSTGVSYLFPVGDNTNYTPMNITYNAGTTLSSAFTDGQLYAVAHPQKGTATSYITRYWPITPSGVTTPDYNAVYTYVDADVIGTEAILFPFKYNSYGWVGSGGSGAAFMQGTGSVNTASNTFTWNNINSFSEFTGLGNGSPLPINLVSFTGKLMEQDVHLNWITVTEQNNDYFTLERSWDGIHFEIITKQKGAGNSNFTLNYFHSDKSVANSGYERVYYRLKQTDFNGAFTYSTTIAIALSPSTKSFYVACFPNPFSEVFQIQVNTTSNETAQLEIYTLSGKLIFAKALELSAAKTVIPIEALKGFFFRTLCCKIDW
ncbi:MAG: T9SS type A sorting domain-containing protein [Bacteroidetes bacterium]|nr:T9SS type A sorting domain-containing protein [Bacteroidota bacterium]